MHAIAGNKAAADADLVRGEAACLASCGLIDARNLKHHVTGEDDGDPKLGSTFTFTHSNFRRALGDWLVREDADENLALTLQEAGESHTAGFDLVVFDPATIKELEAEVTEIELVAAGGVATAIAALLLAVFGSAGEKCHDCLNWRFETGEFEIKRLVLRLEPRQGRLLERDDDHDHRGGRHHRGHHRYDHGADGDHHVDGSFQERYHG